MQNYMTECYSLYKRRQIAIRFTFPGGEGGPRKWCDEILATQGEETGMVCLHFIQSESKNASYITPSSFSINNVVWTDGLVISFFRKKLTTLSYFDTN